MKLQHVPTIDLGPYFEGTAEGKQQVAEAVDRACQDIGFLVITNHGVPQALMDRIYNLSRTFFNQPMAVKRKADRPRPDMVRGYSAVAEESLSYSLEEAAPGDLKESFSIGPVGVPDDDYHLGPAAGPHFAPQCVAGKHRWIPRRLLRLLRSHERPGTIADAHLRPGPEAGRAFL